MIASKSVPDDWDWLLAQLENERAQTRRGAPSTLADEDAWEELSQRIRRLGRLFVGREDLDDLAQNVLIKLQSPDVLRRLRSARAPSGYLAVMVRHAAIDFIRRRATSRDAAEPIEGGSEDLNAVLYGLDHEKRLVVLRKVVARLSDADRLLLQLRFWDEMSIAGIARQFGMPYSTVAVRLFRMLRRLRADLDGGDGEP
jgi:RNA polymerase sigma factor (sigma-70 family)